MKNLHQASRITVVLAVAAAIGCLSARPVSAGLFNRRTVVVASPTYVLPTAPVTTVYSAPAVVAPPLPAAYTTSTVVSSPVRAVYEAPAVVASPVVPTMYAAPVVVRPGLVGPRRMYFVP